MCVRYTQFAVLRWRCDVGRIVSFSTADIGVGAGHRPIFPNIILFYNYAQSYYSESSAFRGTLQFDAPHTNVHIS